ncbi:hypothetical protein GJ633_15075, partial [Halorubrum sp. CBA1125]|nr:hypothetical protein [Halorubrum sp. CBA1125]
MQPSKEREASDGDPMDDLDDLLDDDLADEGDASTTEASGGGSATGSGGGGRIGVDGRWFSLKSFALSLVAVALG